MYKNNKNKEKSGFHDLKQNKPITDTLIYVDIKVLSDRAKYPKRAKKGDICYDLTACSRKIINPFKVHYGFGIALQCELPNYGFNIIPRSSIHKNYMIMSNSFGVIDNEYTGELQVYYYILPWAWLPTIKKFNGKWNFKWNRLPEVGERIAQLQLAPIYNLQFIEVEEMETTDRGHNGFGSTN